ncbi:MAG TPA: hypothetical protein VFT90_18295 [Chryseosolibacter sp.]|nr:hypothetical protein [Chryseosolibacter sp.]
MKRFIYFLKEGYKVSLLLFCCAALMIQTMTFAQSPPGLYARVTMLKAAEGKEKEFENFVKQRVKPLQVIRQQSGEMAFWIFFRVHFAGQADDYNYVGVGYYPSWANTEQETLGELLKQSDGDADVAEFTRLQRELRTVVRESIFYQLEAVEPNPPVPARYVMIGYMKAKPGKQSDYLNIERNEWIPVHQRLLTEGQSAGWGLWQVVFPGGTGSTYDYVTSNRYSTYDQVLQVNYEAMFKKVRPGANVTDILNRTTASRDLVRSELWEVVEMVN